ncbi:MAG: hypothetical protein HDS79_00455 [Bacteroidales bacterium]|nr:hypothetical protein [Bacteroidales bacterium]MDE7464898.1 hypothetical protein [Muribaculaceae bacterium]
MKKLLAGVLMTMGVLFSAFTANAQKGEMSLGVMGGFSTYNNGGFVNANFQYGIADHVTLAPDLGYSFRNEGKSAFLLDVDVRFPFRLAKAFSLYPLVGFTFNNWSYQGGGSASRAGANFGAGFDIYMTSTLKLTLMGKYSVMNDTSGAFFGLGIGYLF